MSKLIIPTTQAHVTRLFGETWTDDGDEVVPAGPLTPGEHRTLTDILAVPGVASVTVVRDWEGIVVASVFGVESSHGIDALYILGDGRIGRAGTNHPYFYATLADLLADR